MTVFETGAHEVRVLGARATVHVAKEWAVGDFAHIARDWRKNAEKRGGAEQRQLSRAK